MSGQGKKPHYQVTAGLVVEGGRVLITRRPKGSHMEGFWEFPGGKQEEGEGLRDCLEREMEEELGLTVSADRFLMTVDHEYDSRVISLHFFECRRMKGDPRGLQGQEIKWVEVGDLKRYPFPPADLALIERLPVLFRESGKE